MILLYKNPGITPLAAINEFRKAYPSYKEKKLAYAGRLDPLAEGLLLLLEGNETKRREVYERLPKVYSFQILFGVATDSYDILGKVSAEAQTLPPLDVFQKNLHSLVPTFKGTWKQPFPPYSAGRVQGKPLYYWARNNLLHTITIPKKEITILEFSCSSVSMISKKHIEATIAKRLSKITGDFRQDTILASWRDYFANTKLEEFYFASCLIHCSSGTYVRSLAYEIGQALSLPSLAWHIKREAVGTHHVTDSLRLHSA